MAPTDPAPAPHYNYLNAAPVASSYTGFRQDPPRLANQWKADGVLRSILASSSGVPKEMYAEWDSDLSRFGDDMVSEQMLEHIREGEENLPRIEQFDGWSARVDKLRTSAAWKEMKKLMAKEKMVSMGYDRAAYGPHARLFQFAKEHVFAPSSSYFICPLGMTDAAARLIELHGKDVPELAEAYQKLTSNDPEKVWTTGQWMTERPGGSDVARTETQAFKQEDGTWRIHGFKWWVPTKPRDFPSHPTNLTNHSLCSISGSHQPSTPT
jgi:hypothetical protein